MMQLIYSAIRSLFTAFAGQNLDIVIGGFAAITRLGAIEFGAIQRHGIDVYLIGRTVHIYAPCRTAFFRRPILRDICPIFGCDTKLCILFGAPFVVELHLIHISLVIHIQNGRAIACDGFAFGHLLIQGKAILVQLSGLGRFACRAGFGFGLCKRIPVIVGVFLPVDHSVLGVFSLPACRNGGCSINRSNLLFVQIPTDKVIACLGGLNIRKIQRFTFNAKLRGNIAAAVRIKGDPIAGFHHGIQRERAFGKLNVFLFQRFAVLLNAPALHGLFASQSQANHFGCRGNIRFAHGIAFGALHGVHHGCAVGAHKVHIADCLEFGIHAHGFAAGNGGGHTIGELLFADKPALKNIAVFLGRSGNFQRIVFGNSLGPIFLNYIIHIELIGIHLEIIGRLDAEGLHCAAKQIADRIFESVPFRSAVFCRGFLELCSISLVRRHIGIVGGPASEGVFHITVGLFNRGFGGLCVFHLFCTGALGKCFGKDRFALAHPSYGKLFCFGKLGFVSLVGRYRLIRMIPAREDVNKLIVCLLNRGFGRLCVFHLFCTGAFGKLCFRQHRFTVFPSYSKLGFAFGSVRDTVFRRVSRRLLRLRLFTVGRGSGLIRHGGTGLGLLSLIGFSLVGCGLIGFILSGLSLLVFRLLSIELSSLTLDGISLCGITFFALVFVALALFDFRDAWGVLYEILGQNAGGEHGKHHGNGKDHGNDSFFHRFFLLFFQIFSTLAGG